MNAKLSLREKVGQLLLIGFRGYEVGENDPVVRDLAERNVGAIILFDQEMADTTLVGRNIKSPEQVKGLTDTLKKFGGPELLIAIDQEGGRVNRLKAAYGFPETLSHDELGVMNDWQATRMEGEKIARTLVAAGINFNLAPVVDLDLGPDNPIIKGKKRSFGSDPRKVSAHARAYIEGLHAHGILSCIKHFPGHGSARGDTHLGLVDVTDTWTEKELEPFTVGSDAVMTAHVFNSRLDPKYPATLSKATLRKLRAMGFDGAILSDDMEMKAISAQFGLEQAVESALNAGIDLLCFGNNMSFDREIGQRVSDLVVRLVESGRVSEGRIDDAFARVQALKAKLR